MVKVSNRGASRIKAGHPWVYRNDLESIGGLKGGEIVPVADNKGNFLAKAFYSSESLIALRILTTEDIPIDDNFLAERVSNAFALRKQIIKRSNAFRIVFGESDLLPSVIVDKYDDYLALQTLSQGAELLKPRLVEILVDLFKPKGVMERNDPKTREREGLSLVKSVLYGDVPEAVEIFESETKFYVDMKRSQKTGFFLDQRDNRLAAAVYAKGHVLDCFCFAGAFASHMAPHAESVLAIDVSPIALEQGKRNAELNHNSNIRFMEANVFDTLHDLDREKSKFDTIVLDPPAFAKSKAAVAAAARGYKEINLRAMRLLNQGGILITSSCSFHLSEPQFWEILAEAAADAGRSLQIVEKRMQACDHPVLLTMPESYYLKCFFLKVI